MAMSDRDIIEAVKKEELKISGFGLNGNDKKLQPASYDLTLGQCILVYKASDFIVDPRKPIGEQITPVTLNLSFTTGEGRFALFPGDLVLGSTVETIELSNKVQGQIVGKSSLARLGLMVETAGFVDPGWRGNLTLEISSVCHKIVLYAGMPIAQICFAKLDTPSDRIYGDTRLGSKYQFSRGPQESQYNENFRDN